MAAHTGNVRLTPDNLIAAQIVQTPKGTTTVSVNRGDILILSSNKWRPVATITDASESNTLGVSENYSPGSGDNASRRVNAYVAQENIVYECGLNTLTSVNVGTLFKLVTVQCRQIAASTTVTDDRVAVAVAWGGASKVNKAQVRFLKHTYDLERG